MKAIVIRPGEPGSVHMRDMPDPRLQPDQVLVKTMRVGLCGIDGEINQGLYGAVPAGEEFLILGHENLGTVAEAGRNTEGFTRGDLVVATVRRPCGRCDNCDDGESDCCTSGTYADRGIRGRHGFLSEYYAESPAFLVKVPEQISDVAVLTEPTSAVEKGLDHAFILQKRLRWRPKLSLVLGAGPVGLLTAAVLRARGMRTVVVGREPASDVRGRIATQMGAEYLSAEKLSPMDLPEVVGPIDLAVDATGAATVAFTAMQILGPNAVLCLLGVAGGFRTAEHPVEPIKQKLVLGNQVVFGSGSAGPRHFAMAVADLVTVQQNWPGTLAKVITSQLPWDRYGEWFGKRGVGIKTTLEIS